MGRRQRKAVAPPHNPLKAASSTMAAACSLIPTEQRGEMPEMGRRAAGWLPPRPPLTGHLDAQRLDQSGSPGHRAHRSAVSGFRLPIRNNRPPSGEHTIDIRATQQAASPSRRPAAERSPRTGRRTAQKAKKCCREACRMLRSVLGASGPCWSGARSGQQLLQQGFGGALQGTCWDHHAEACSGSGVDSMNKPSQAHGPRRRGPRRHEFPRWAAAARPLTTGLAVPNGWQ